MLTEVILKQKANIVQHHQRLNISINKETKMTSMEVGSGDDLKLLQQGAEAKVYVGQYFDKPAVIKERFSKGYRHPVLDKSLTSQRMKSEVKSMMRCRSHGIHCPAVYFVDAVTNKIYMEHIVDSTTVKDYIRSVQANKQLNHTDVLKPLAEKIGATIGTMHEKNIIHGDLTTSNMLLRKPVEDLNLVMIDFGLGYVENVPEDKAVDLYVLERALLSTHPNTEALFQIMLESYVAAYKVAAGRKNVQDTEEIIRKYEEVRLRGRKRTMVG